MLSQALNEVDLKDLLAPNGLTEARLTDGLNQVLAIRATEKKQEDQKGSRSGLPATAMTRRRS
ncbi:hypothetical protein BH23BAC4_BH23BAC4_07580 [soil metagenome]